MRSKQGTARFSGNGTQIGFRIEHGENSRPVNWEVTPHKNSDSLRIVDTFANEREIIVELENAPPSGKKNVAFEWKAQFKEKKHNTSYTIRVRDPLLRPGMEIEAGPVSEDYVVPTAKKLMHKIREIND